MNTKRSSAWLALACWCSFSAPLDAQTEQPDAVGWGDDGSDAAGFADAPKAASEPHVAEDAPNLLSLTGFARSQWGLWLERLEDNPFAKGRQSLDLQLRLSTEHWRVVASAHGEYDLAYQLDRDSYDDATLDAYERLVDVRETYISGTLEPLEFTFGRMVMPWGQGDVVSILDVVAPRDLREPGLSDLEDLRLPVLATRFGFFFGYHRIEAVIIHEAFFGYRPAPLGEFSPVRSLIADETGLDAGALAQLSDVRFRDRGAGLTFEKQQYALTWSYKGPEFDASIYVASIVDQFGVFAGLEPELTLTPIPSQIDVVLDHPRYTLFGYSGAAPFGDWLVKWEFSVTPARTYNQQPPDGRALEFLLEPADFTQKATFAGAMVGITYSGLPHTLLFLEGAQSTPLDGAKDTLFGSNAPVLALRSMHLFFDDDLRADLALYGVGYGLEYGFLARAELTYRLNDDFKVGLGAITYHPGEELGLLSGLGKHDRLFASMRWDFHAF
ncbi:MAG TPA: DUF1302 family protein [Polyangiaceae bacterium]|nr:DUF1302 family protein [Polyangiaceae bacterium]